MKNQRSKKRIGIISMMLVLLFSVGAVAGTTLAKYVTSATVESKQATVAKWGVTATFTDNLFGEFYSERQIKTAADTAILDVASATGNKLVAPGTEGGYLSLSLAGAPEVASRLTIDFEVMEIVYLQIDTGLWYYPINWYVAGELVEVVDVVNNVSAKEPEKYLSELNAVMGNMLDAKEAYFRPNEDISANYTNLDLISWDWAFENATFKSYNDYDTILGDLAADSEFYKTSDSSVVYGAAEGQLNYGITIKVSMTATLEQVQNDSMPVSSSTETSSSEGN